MAITPCKLNVLWQGWGPVSMRCTFSKPASIIMLTLHQPCWDIIKGAKVVSCFWYPKICDTSKDAVDLNVYCMWCNSWVFDRFFILNLVCTPQSATEWTYNLIPLTWTELNSEVHDTKHQILTRGTFNTFVLLNQKVYICRVRYSSYSVGYLTSCVK